MIIIIIIIIVQVRTAMGRARAWLRLAVMQVLVSSVIFSTLTSFIATAFMVIMVVMQVLVGSVTFFTFTSFFLPSLSLPRSSWSSWLSWPSCRCLSAPSGALHVLLTLVSHGPFPYRAIRYQISVFVQPNATVSQQSLLTFKESSKQTQSQRNGAYPVGSTHVPRRSRFDDHYDDNFQLTQLCWSRFW